jgi:Flp pilus assembly protein protease CpaA
MVGVFFLGRGVLKAAEHRSGAVRFALGRLVLATALIGAVSMFLLIDGGTTTTNFMLDLGDQPSAGAYSMIQFTYYAIVLAAMALLAARQIRRSDGVERLPTTSLVVGGVLGVFLSGVVITMDIAHLAGDLSLMRAVSVAYGPLQVLTFVLLCGGFAGQPAIRALRARSRDRQTRSLAAELGPLWVAATAARPGISHNAPGDVRPDPETLLHRQLVEIRDAVMDARVAFDISDHGRHLIDSAERHLLGGDSIGSLQRDARPRTSRASSFQ